jgi:hypothetical protein
MRSRDTRHFLVLLACSFALLVLAAVVSQGPINLSLVFLIGSFWSLIAICAGAVVRLLQEKDEEKR